MLHALRMPRLVCLSSDVVAFVPRFPWAWFGFAILAATMWTAVALTQNNLEMQSIDLCHHAMFVHHLQTPWSGFDRDFVGAYPLLAHRVATIWMPIFHNPIQSVRAAALACLLVMYVAQWFLLRTRLSPAWAMLVLVAWQCLCTTCKLGNVNHFLWDFQYNYSRAVSAAALWVMILVFVTPPSRYRVLNVAVAIGLAAFAFRCHIAAGSLALATCGAWCIVNLLRRAWLPGLSGLIALSLTGAAMLLFTDEWRYLASLSNDNGPMPIRHESLIALWIPTTLFGLGYAFRKAWEAYHGNELTINATTAVLCGLLPAAVLQGYMLYGKNVTHTIGTYPYNQMLFYTFELATLFLVVILFEALPIAKCGRANSQVFHSAPQPRSILVALATIAFAWGLFTILEKDAHRTAVETARDPIVALQELEPFRDQFRGHYYYDPHLEHASYFVTRCLLGRDSQNAARYRLHCHLRKPGDLFREPELKGLFVPACFDIDMVVGPACPRERIGSFWKCDLIAYRKTMTGG